MKPMKTSARPPGDATAAVASTRSALRRRRPPRARRRCGRRRTCRGRRRRARSASIASPTTPAAGTTHGVRALAERLRGLARRDVDGAQRLGERGQRLHGAAHDERLAGRHAALDAAGAVGLAEVAAVLVVEDLVVRLRARAAREVEAVAEADALERLDGEQRHADPAVHPLLPRHVGAEPGREPEGAQLEDAAERLVALAQHVDLLAPSRGSPPASRQRTGDASTSAKSASARSCAVGRADGADLRDVRDHLGAHGAQERLRERTARDPRRGLPRARALEHVAHVGEAELPDAREVGVAGARQVHLGHVGLDRPRVHPLLPVGVVAVGDLEGDGAAERAAVADAGGDLRGVLLDLHAAAAAVAELAPRHVRVDRLAVEREPGGQALDDGGQAGPVRLPGGDDAQRHARQPRRLPGAPRAARWVLADRAGGCGDVALGAAGARSTVPESASKR